MTIPFEAQRHGSRLIDAYEDGLLEKSEFDPRVRQARERLKRLQQEAVAATDRAAQRDDLRLVLAHLEDFAQQVRQGLDQADVIGDAIGCIFVGADIDADDSPTLPSPACGGGKRGGGARGEALKHDAGALRIKAEPVDYALIGVEPEHPRPRIADLRLGRDGADLDEAEA